jgi:glycosyltransferase involved in cell wall biosynthesis
MISVVMPCYNEEEIVERSYHAIKRVVEEITSEYEILFANDGSTDGTLAVLEHLKAADSHVGVISYTPNRGAGYAHRQLYATARGDRVILLEADLAMSPKDVIAPFLEHLETWDVVVGSRYKGVAPDYPWYRRIVSNANRMLVRTLFGLDLHDTQAGFSGFRKSVLDSIELTSDRWEALVELYARAKARGFKILEVPVKFVHGTETGQTNVLVEAPRQLFNTLRLWWRLRGIATRGSQPSSHATR